MKREKSDLRAQYDAFLADNEDYLKELDASRLGKTLEDAKKMKAKFLARFPGLEQREEAAISEVDKITERKHKRYKQLQNVEDYISWLTQGKENLNKEQAEVEAQLAARRKEHRESPEESIIAADILTLHHQKQTMQDKVDVLIMKEMQEQQEIAKLRKALDHSVGLLYLGELPRAINGLARRALPLSFSPLLTFLRLSNTRPPQPRGAIRGARKDPGLPNQLLSQVSACSLAVGIWWAKISFLDYTRLSLNPLATNRPPPSVTLANPSTNHLWLPSLGSRRRSKESLVERA